MHKYNVMTGLIDDGHGHTMAYKTEELDDKYGLYYKVEDVKALEDENIRLKVLLEYHGINEKIFNTPEIEAQYQEYLKINNIKPPAE